MKLKTLTLHNFRCFKQLNLNLQSDLIVLVGKNASGKTTILDAIALALSTILTELPGLKGMNFKETDFLLEKNQESAKFRKAPYVGIKVESRNGTLWDRYKKRDKTIVINNVQHYGLKQIKQYTNTIIKSENENLEYTLPVMVYYGTNRAVLDIPYSRKGFSKTDSRFQALANCLESSSRFRSSFNNFYLLQEEENLKIKEKKSLEYRLPALEAVRIAITSMIPEFSNPRIELRPLRFIVTYANLNEKYDYELEQLSAGYKNLLALVMDLAIRMVEANPHSQKPLEEEAIVLIDEIDLHLHPSWQVQVVHDLQKTFPNTQFILTTHSPQVLYNILRDNILLLDNFKIMDTPYTYGRAINSIVQNVFATDYRIKDVSDKIDCLHELIDDNSKEKANKLLSELKLLIGEDDPDITMLTSYLEFLE